MIRRRSLAWLLPALLLAGTSCAPQDEAPDRPASSQAGNGARTDQVLPPVPASLKDRIDAALDNARQRPLLTTHAFWTIFHGILGLGLDVPLLNPDTGQHV